MSKLPLSTQVTMSHTDRTFSLYLWKEGKRAIVVTNVEPLDGTMAAMSREAAQFHHLLQGFEKAYDYMVHNHPSWLKNLETTWSILEQTQNYLSESK